VAANATSSAVPTWTPKENPEALVVPVLGKIEGASNPESSELLLDGEHFVFGNCTLVMDHPEGAERGYPLVYVEGEAFVTLGRIGPDRKVELIKRKVAEGLTGTLGIDVIKADNPAVKAGTAFVAEGAYPASPRGGTKLNMDYRPRLVAIDALGAGKIGEIPLGPESVIGRRFNRIEHPNGVAADSEGNLYFGDIANGRLEGGTPAMYRIPREAIAGLMAGDDAAAALVTRILMPSHVNGLTVSPVDQSIWAVSCAYNPEDGGGVYRVTAEDFKTGRTPKPNMKGLGSGVLDGIGVTKRGNVLVSCPMTGELHIFTAEGDQRVIMTSEGKPAGLPPDFNVCYPKSLGGEPAILLPDLSLGKGPEEASVAVLDLSGY